MGPLWAGIAEKVRTAGLGEHVHLLGDVDEAAKIRAMAMMDLLAFPSTDTTEAFGLAQVGAWARAARERALRLFALRVFEERLARVFRHGPSGQALGTLTKSVFAEPDRTMVLAP
jgi:glycosyltransferase involved in cell wall biosynthesis